MVANKKKRDVIFKSPRSAKIEFVGLGKYGMIFPFSSSDSGGTRLTPNNPIR
jgi:hypothetical protein